MQNVIYIDILISLNLFINYFLLLATAKFLDINYSRIKLFLGALLGAFFSLYILIPPLAFWFSAIVEIIMACIIVITAFNVKNFKTMLRISSCFFSINFSFAGVIFLIWKFFAPNGLVMNNGIVYFNSSPLTLILSTVFSYVIIRLFNKLTGKTIIEQKFCKLEIEQDSKVCYINAKIDTGNSLNEPFSNLPVIITTYKFLENILPKTDLEIFKNHPNDLILKREELTLNFRVIPFSSIGGNGILMGFKPDKITILNNGYKYEKEAYVGICDKKYLTGEIESLVGPDLLNNLEKRMECK